MKRKRYKSPVKYIISVTVICVLSFTGVSYAYWTDSVEVANYISTGRISSNITYVYGNTMLTWLSIKNNYIFNSNTINFSTIRGTLGCWNIVHFKLKNDGTIPIKIYPEDITFKFLNSYRQEIISDNGTLAFIMLDNKDIQNIENKNNAEIDKFIKQNNLSSSEEIEIDIQEEKVIYLLMKAVKSGVNNYCYVTIPFTQFNANKKENLKGQYDSWTKEIKIEFADISII